MKKLLLIIFISFFCCMASIAQNLVPNPSFEEYLNCPDNENQVQYAFGWSNRGNTTPDYFNSCSPFVTGFSTPYTVGGFQIPANGNAYCGFYSHSWLATNNYREYIGATLTNSLQISHKYYIKLKVSLANNTNCGSNNIGILFSSVPYWYDYNNPNMTIKNFAHIYTNLIITDTLNWTTIYGSFTADSVYNYIAIGNFFNDSNTTFTILNSSNHCSSYYFIDNICVSTDSIFCDTTVYIKDFYFNKKLSIHPNPLNDKIYLIIKENYDECDISIFDFLGKLIMSRLLKNNENELFVGNIDNGLYIIKLTYNNETIINKFIKN